MKDLLFSERFPRSSRYNPEWIKAGVSGGANPLWLTEWLSSSLDLQPGMKVLDLGCGRALSSIFLAREFGVQVWAADLLISPSENFQRIQDAGVAGNVFPLKLDARHLPFAANFFDVIISIDSFMYYGTDDLYLNYILRFVKPDGQIAIAGAGIMQEMTDSVPEHLREWWTPDLWCLHSAQWWKGHWERTGFVNLHLADTMQDGWKYWLAWHETIAPDNKLEIEALKADQGRSLGYVRVIARPNSNIQMEDSIVSIPAQYINKPLLRES